MTTEKTKRLTIGQLGRCLHDSRGSALPMMAAALIPTMAMIGSGIDFGRAYLADSKLQGAVDAAALSAVRAKQITGTSTAGAKIAAEKYLNANFPSGYVGSNVLAPTILVTDSNNLIKAQVNATGTVRTTLLRLVGIETLSIGAQAIAEASETLPTSVEALLVLDNTGSMAGTRMSQLKTASKNFIDIIYGSKETRKGFAVGILPYNTMVNVGHLVAAHDSSMVISRPGFTDVSPTDALGWKGCLFADKTIRGISTDPFTMDFGAFDIGAGMPGENGMPAFDPFIYPPIYVDSFQDINNRYKVPASRHAAFYEIPTIKTALQRLHGKDICVKRNNGNNADCSEPNTVISFDRLPDKDQYVDARFYSHKSGASTKANPNNLWGASPNYQCPQQALPLSYSYTKSTLKNYVDQENAALKPGTGTFHSPAMAWAYRMMQRDDVFPRNRPINVPVKKVVIFMTDGNFDSRDDGRTDSDGKKVYDTAYTAYKSYEDRVMISGTGRTPTISALAARFSKTCEAMKADGIQIYTIAFALANNAEGNATRTMFRACATDQNTHFFSAANGAQLNEAFITIASELIDLRLTN